MKQNKKIIALTGSISTGKSAVSKILTELGEVVIDLDEIGHEVLKDSEVISEIRNNFGGEYIKNYRVNREKLGPAVFKDKEKLELLNSIMHKRIFDVMKDRIKNSESNLVFVDIPLLFEIRSKLSMYGFSPDFIWLIYINRDLQIKRLMKRDNIDYEYALNKVNSQMNIEDKKILSDVVIDNSGNLEELKETIKKELWKLKQ